LSNAVTLTENATGHKKKYEKNMGAVPLLGNKTNPGLGNKVEP